ncbi:NAD(P)-dependent oxidoreductase [Sphingomonas cynarae]|uniref:NAD(P)-dependent oxidoreductase n=1 Tax=Sphingomonas cynarae TaxID=930197 RepID=A0ABP7EQ23_9SPHN
MKTAIVTGASGYLGGHVTRRLLAADWRVVALVRPDSSLPDDLSGRVVRVDYSGTLESVCTAFAQAPIDLVVHLASAVVGVHRPNQVDSILDANVRLPTHLLEAMRQSSCRRIVNTGTFWQHCNTDGYVPVNLYAATKQAFEDIARAYVENDGIRICTLILYDTYGADDPRAKIVRLLVEAIGASEPLLLSPGDQILDLTSASDVADAFVVAAGRMMHDTKAREERFRVSGTRLSLKALVERIRALADAPLNVELGSRPYRAREIMQPLSAAVPSLPGWYAQHVLDHEITAMIRAHRRDG